MREFNNPFETNARPVATPNPFDPAPHAPVAPAPEAQTGLRDAPVGARVSGALFDSCALALLLVVPVFTAYGLTKGLDPELGETLTGLSILAGFGMYLALQSFLISTQGQSIGKVMAQTRIVRSDGSPVGFFHGVLLRSWAWTVICQLPLIGIFANLGDLISLFAADRRTLHDRIADTKVVQIRR